MMEVRMRRRIELFQNRGFERRSSVIAVPNMGRDELVLSKKTRKKFKKISKLRARFAAWLYVSTYNFKEKRKAMQRLAALQALRRSIRNRRM